jgi:hypothetical protein
MGALVAASVAVPDGARLAYRESRRDRTTGPGNDEGSAAGDGGCTSD